MANATTQVQSSPAIGAVVLILAAVVFLFWLGIWARGVLDKTGGRLNRKQIAATLLVTFIMFGLPYGKAIEQAVLGTQDIWLWLAAAVPPVFSGLTSREQIKKILAGD
jgi:hypothetical protein